MFISIQNESGILFLFSKDPLVQTMSQDSSVSKVTGCGLDDQNSVPRSNGNYSLHHHIQTIFTSSCILLSRGYWQPLCMWTKQLEHITDHLHLSSSRVYDMWGFFTSTSLLYFHGTVLRHWDNFMCLFYRQQVLQYFLSPPNSHFGIILPVCTYSLSKQSIKICSILVFSA